MINSLIIVILILTFFIAWRFLIFFRNPPRYSSAPYNAVLSPADGYVLYIRHITDNKSEVFSIKNNKRILLHELMLIRESDCSFNSGWLIGITMTPFDVHYNRAPVSGYIEKTGHEFPSGLKRNFSMFPALQNLFFGIENPYQDCEYLIHNERASYIFSNDVRKIYVTQIADKYVKKIITSKDREKIVRGEIFGLIRMGSQVDIFIPDPANSLKINISEKQHLKAGVDIITWL